MTSAEAAAALFNAMINSRDLDGLASLMTDGHTFIDRSGHAVAGRQSCREAWSGFFDAYPSYRNLFESVHEEGGIVVIVGRSVCSEDPVLDGPALWTARVEGNLVTEWRVYDDTGSARPARPHVDGLAGVGQARSRRRVTAEADDVSEAPLLSR